MTDEPDRPPVEGNDNRPATAEEAAPEAVPAAAAIEEQAWAPFPSKLRLRGERGRFFPKRKDESQGEEPSDT